MLKKTLIVLSLLALAPAQAAAQTGAARVTRTAPNGARVVSVGPRTTYLKEGLSTEDVLKLLGRPAEVSEREEGGAVLVSYVYQRGAGRVLVAEFVDGLLVRSRVEARLEGIRADAGGL